MQPFAIADGVLAGENEVLLFPLRDRFDRVCEVEMKCQRTIPPIKPTFI
jgi:hypothetical protein